MLARLRDALVSPATGLVAMAVALALAVALGAASSGWRGEQARYEARIAELTRATERAEAGFRTELAACRAVGEARRVTGADFAVARGPTPEGARRLLEQQPEGIDACARMESADQAVLANLKE